MLFKGSEAFPKGEIDKQIARNGGMMNGFTWLDFTTFFETLPADRIDLGLRIEADRMVNTLFDPDEVALERTVIISERQGAENEPTFLLGEEVVALPSGYILTIMTPSATCAIWRRSAMPTCGAITRPTMAPTTPLPWP
jgi:predicted Zn-dependent peptidase